MLERSTRTIVNQVNALKGMVDAFSQYARSQEAPPQSLDLNQLLRDVLALYDASRLRVDLAPRVEAVFGDPGQLRQVIHNLLQNAQDATADVSTPRISVRTESHEGAVLMVVEDNGVGFPESILSRAFEPYVTTKQKGTGLGLAIVKKIIDEHGGKASIENLKPRGAAVRIMLPALSVRTGARRTEVRA
jgi:nitrogen fixation/metabolism regulation signal transduction histidine kinase